MGREVAGNDFAVVLLVLLQRLGIIDAAALDAVPTAAAGPAEHDR